MTRSCFVVEGPHDLEVVGRMLGERGFHRLNQFEELDEYWHRLVPRTFPHKGDLLRRVPVPVFFAAAGASVAVQSAVGDTKIATLAVATVSALDTPPDALGIVLDADSSAPPLHRWNQLKPLLPVPSIGNGPGDVATGPIRAGVFVVPDNTAHGTIEDILMECAEQAYPELLRSARAWIDAIDPNDAAIFVNADERRDFGKPAGKSKAIVGAVANVLRPGKAVQVSLQDNRWLRDPKALALPRVARVQAFVDAILGLPAAHP